MSNQRPYRAIPIAGGGFVYGWYVHAPQPNHSNHEDCIFDIKKYESGECFAFSFCRVQPSTVGQATTWEDKDRTTIYAGDRIKVGELHIVTVAIDDIKGLAKIQECVERGIWLEIVGNIHTEQDTGGGDG